MAGHSHWAGIKHKKGLKDARRGKLFSKMAKLIMSAARAGGPDPDANLSLKYAIERARAVSMPKENIERAIAKGAGELPGEKLESLTYEGYGPGKTSILVDVLTDNRNRTNAEIRKIFESKGGKVADPGGVAWLFEKKGLFSVPVTDGVDGEKLFEVAIEADAEDIVEDERCYEITCAPENFMKVKNALEEAGFDTEVAEISSLPKNRISLDAETARKVLVLMDALEDHDDVQSVYSNFDIPDEVLKELEEEE